MLNKTLVLSTLIFFILIPPLSAQESDSPGFFDILHMWWPIDHENFALKVFSEAMVKRGIEWEEKEVSESNFHGIRAEFADRVAFHDAPAAVQWIGGKSMRELVKDGTFRLIKSGEHNIDFAQILLPEVYDVLKYKDGITALPLGIHTQNHVIYNKAIYDKLGLNIPQSWDEFIQSAKIIKAAGYIPLSISDQRWQLRFFFNSILAAKLSAEEFMSLLKGEISPSSQLALKESFELVGVLREFANSDNKNMPWANTVEKVVKGKAAANFLGDFIAPFFTQATADEFECGLAPGNRYFLWAFDTVALSETTDKDRQKGQNAFIQVATSVKNLTRYTPLKGGISPYNFINPLSLDFCSRKALKNWNSSEIRIHLGPDDWNSVLNTIASLVQRHWQDPNSSADKRVVEVVETLKILKKKRDLKVSR